MRRVMFDAFFQPIGFDLLMRFDLFSKLLIGQSEIIFGAHLTNIKETVTAAEFDDGLRKLLLPQTCSQAGRRPTKTIDV